MSRLANSRKTLSLEEISDRMFVEDLILEEASAIDERDWDRWEATYVSDAKIDWSGNGGAKGDPKAIRAWASAVLSTENFPYPQYQHYCTNFRIRVDGDAASCRHLQIIPISVVSPGGGRQIAFSGIWFEDELVRTAEGWRICARKEFRAWQHNFPATFEVPKG